MSDEPLTGRVTGPARPAPGDRHARRCVPPTLESTGVARSPSGASGCGGADRRRLLASRCVVATGPTSSGSARRAELDSLRGLAALSVLLFHVWLYTLARPLAATRRSAADLVFSELRVGLVLFFVLSGFLLYQPWVAAAMDGSGSPSVGRYLRRRAARIVPAYYVALLGSIVLLWGAAGTAGVRLPPAGHLWTFFLFAQNYVDDSLMRLNPPMWTLVVEVSFYLALPLVGWMAQRVRPTRLAQASIPALLVAGGVLFNDWLSVARYDVSPTLSKLLPAMLPYFGVGMLAAVLLHRRSVSRSAGVLLAVAGVLLVVANAYWRDASQGTLAPVVLRDLIAAFGFASLMAAASASGVARWLGARPLAALGTISYGLYLWHVPLLLWTRSEGLLPLSPLPALAIVLPASIAVAAASWVFVERPALRHVRRRDRRRRSALAVDAGPA